MSHQQKSHRLALIFFAIILAIILPSNYAAASSTTVAPAYLRFSVSEQSPSSTAAFAVVNNSSRTVAYTAKIVDVDVQSGSLTPIDSASLATKSMFSLQQASFSLVAGQSVNVLVNAYHSAAAAPGGHYAAVLLSQDQPINNTKPTIQNMVSVGLFLVKEEGVVRQLQTKTSLLPAIVTSLPSKDTISIKNTGNSDVVPSGYVMLKKGDNVLSKAIFNDQSRSLFANTTYEFTADFSSIKGQWPGKYTREVLVRYNGQEAAEVTVSNFWYLPVWSMLLSIFLVAILSRVGYKRYTRLRLHKKKQTVQPQQPIVQNSVAVKRKIPVIVEEEAAVPKPPQKASITSVKDRKVSAVRVHKTPSATKRKTTAKKKPTAIRKKKATKTPQKPAQKSKEYN